MRIRSKMILVVLPLLIGTLGITGIISSYSARQGMIRIAMNFWGFKAQEMQKNMDNQWNLLVQNEFHNDPEYVDVAKNAVASFAATLTRSSSEVIMAVDPSGTVVMSTRELALNPEDGQVLFDIVKVGEEGWVTLVIEDKVMVGQAFRFVPFDWYVLLLEDQLEFSREGTRIIYLNFIVMGGSLVVSLVLLVLFTALLGRPLVRVVNAMRGIITTNDLTSRVAVEFNDEIGELAHTFNLMIAELDRAYEQIKEFAFKAVLAKKNETKIRNIFQKYVPKNVIDTIFDNPESALVGEARIVAVLFSDIRSFTTISEGYRPDELVEALNRYFEFMVDIIIRRGGVIDKYIGDAIMAFFGAPVKGPDDALQAVYAALDMQAALLEFNKELTKEGRTPFLTGVGINYGLMTVGNIGSEKKMDYTVIGDMVNLGSRLEGLTKPYGQPVVFSESVYRKVRDFLPCRMLDKVVVKGKTSGEKIYTARYTLTAEEVKGWSSFHAGMRAYYEQKFTEAGDLFKQTLTFIPDDKPSKIFLDRCNELVHEDLPADWNGIVILKEK